MEPDEDLGQVGEVLHEADGALTELDAEEDEYGVEDAWPVIAEPFLQWVIEDTFVVGRPRWELAMPSDVLVTSNVEPYERMKLRLLNSAHSALSYAALLCDHVHVDSALADPDVLNKFEQNVKTMDTLLKRLKK